MICPYTLTLGIHTCAHTRSKRQYKNEIRKVDVYNLTKGINQKYVNKEVHDFCTEIVNSKQKKILKDIKNKMSEKKCHRYRRLVFPPGRSANLGTAVAIKSQPPPLQKLTNYAKVNI